MPSLTNMNKMDKKWLVEKINQFHMEKTNVEARCKDSPPYEWIQHYNLEYKFEKDLIITNTFGHTLTISNVYMQLFEHIYNLDYLTQKIIKLFTQIKYSAQYMPTNSIVLVCNDFEIYFVNNDDNNNDMFCCEEEQVKLTNDKNILLSKRLIKVITYDINNINLLQDLKIIRTKTFAQIIERNKKCILDKHGWSYCTHLHTTEIIQDDQTSEFYLVTRLKKNISNFIMAKYNESKPNGSQVREIIFSLNKYDTTSKEIELDIKNLMAKIEILNQSPLIELHDEYENSIKNGYKILFTDCIEQINARRIEYTETKPKPFVRYRRRVTKSVQESISSDKIVELLKHIKEINALDILDILSDVWTYQTFQDFYNVHHSLEPKYLALVKSLYDMNICSRQSLLLENGI